MVRPAPADPPEVWDRLWEGTYGGLAFDIGVNCGQTIPEIQQRFTALVGFEPCQESFLAAQEAFPHVIIRPEAVSDHDGLVTLALAEGLHEDTGMLVSPGTHGMEWDVGVLESGTVHARKVPCRSLDSLAAEHGLPDFCKVDTEGHELLILLGGLDVLDQRSTRWLIEFHSAALHDRCTWLLERSGHAVETVRHPRYAEGTDMWYRHGWLRAEPKAML